jgi:hypothetical protein
MHYFRDTNVRDFIDACVWSGYGHDQRRPIGSTYTLVQHLYNKGWINQFMGERRQSAFSCSSLRSLFTILQLRTFKAV